MEPTVLFSQADGVARLVFNNPARHNALGQAELAAIEAAIDGIAPETRVLLLHATGDKTFCAGADLAQINSGELSGDRFQSVTNRIAAAPVPTIALINGNVFGGGVELSVSCDFRIGVAGTRMRVPAAALGLCYPPDGIRRLVSRLGVTVAKRVLVAAEELPADEMLRCGIVDRLVPPEDAVDTGLTLARQLAGLAPLAVSSMLELMRQAETGSFDMDHANRLAARCADSADFREGLQARSEGRVPQFTGR